MRTLIVIPAFNEQEALPGVLKELASRVPEYDVLVVNDGSSDHTPELARSAGVIVADLPFNLGIGGALRTGFRCAVEDGYDRVVQFDGDGQHDPDEIPILLRALDQGADLVVGSRFAADESSYEVGRIRSGAMRSLRLTVKLLSGQRFSDPSSGFRSFSRPMLDFFARTYPVEYMDSVEALLLACYAGFTVVETPVAMRRRTGGTASNRNIKLLYHYLRLMIVLLSTAPVGARRTRADRRGSGEG
jgi:glycosyltransferase involved in cell wall biosynthesis